jgi:hypothetical protein
MYNQRLKYVFKTQNLIKFFVIVGYWFGLAVFGGNQLGLDRCY